MRFVRQIDWTRIAALGLLVGLLALRVIDPVPVQIVVLDRVRVGEVEITQVGALVMPQPMPYVLLGNSFLTRFQMRRDNDVLRLELR